MEENIVWENDWAKFMAKNAKGDWIEYEKKPWYDESLHVFLYFGERSLKKNPPSTEVLMKDSLIERFQETEQEKIQHAKEWPQYLAVAEDGTCHICRPHNG